MSSLEFVLALIIVLAIFLAFTMALLITMLVNEECQSAVKALFKVVLETFAGFFS